MDKPLILVLIILSSTHLVVLNKFINYSGIIYLFYIQLLIILIHLSTLLMMMVIYIYCGYIIKKEKGTAYQGSS